MFILAQNINFMKTSVDFDELADLQFIYGVKDYFALEHHMEKINIGFKGLELLNNAVYTNSDDTIINLLLNTDLCRLGINATEKNTKDTIYVLCR